VLFLALVPFLRVDATKMMETEEEVDIIGVKEGLSVETETEYFSTINMFNLNFECKLLRRVEMFEVLLSR